MLQYLLIQTISSSQPQGPIMLQYLLVQLDLQLTTTETNHVTISSHPNNLQLTTTGTDHVTISSRPARSPAHNHRDQSCYNIFSSKQSPAHNHRDRSCYNIFSSSSISSSQPQGPIMLQYRLVQLDLQLTTTGTNHVTISSRPARSPAHNHRDQSCYNIFSSKRSPAHNHKDRSCYNIVSSSSISSSQPQGPIMLQYLLVQLDLQLTTTETNHVTISSHPNDLQLTTTGTDHVTISSRPARSLCLALHLQNEKVHI